MRFTVDGLTNLINKVGNIIDESLDAVDDGLLAGATKIAQEAASRAPVDTGDLKESIKPERVQKTKTLVAYNVGSKLRYAIYQEFGTGIYAENGDGRQTPWRYKNREGRWVFTQGIRPRPYLRPAFDHNIENVKSSVGDSIERLIENA